MPQPQTVGYRNVLYASILSISTLTFYSVLCILLSYAILDFISPHPGISTHNKSVDLTAKTFQDSSSQIPLLGSTGDAKLRINGGIPSSDTPWDSETPAGAKVLKFLSKTRFPLTMSKDLPLGFQGMVSPPKLTWPQPAELPRMKITTPIPIHEIYSQAQSSGAIPRQTWDPSSSNFAHTSRRRVQWSGFQDRTSWDTPHQMVVSRERQEWVTRAFSHAWEGYKRFGWGFDTISPLSNKGVNTFAGWGATIVTSLDTLLIMNMTREYNYARTHVRAIDWSRPMKSDSKPGSTSTDAPDTFESVVRYLGALISAYDLSGDHLMLSKAEELAAWLLPAFGTKTGIPVETYQIGSNPSGSSTGPVRLATAGGFILEFTRLSQITGKDYYINAAQRALGFLGSEPLKASTRLGTLLPSRFEPEKPDNMTGVYNFRYGSKSYYEYLLKQQLLLLGKPSGSYEPFTSAIDASFYYFFKNVKFRPSSDGLTIVGEQNNTGGRPVYMPSMTQDSCSSAAFIGLGSRVAGRPGDLERALQQTESCVWAYESSPTGLAAEALLLPDPENPDSQKKVFEGISLQDPQFMAYPDTIEAVFYMWRLTGDRKWQDKGWKMFTNWVQQCITESGFAQLKDASNATPDGLQDAQGAHVISETFKYYYLLFADPSFISLDAYVFNTAAHPFKIPTTQPPGSSLWKGPQDAIDSELNPPTPNQVNTHSHTNSQNVTSWGTAIQQWSWVGNN